MTLSARNALLGVMLLAAFVLLAGVTNAELPFAGCDTAAAGSKDACVRPAS